MIAVTAGMQRLDATAETLIPEVAGAIPSGRPGRSIDGAAASQLIPEVADPITASEGRTYTHEGSGNFRLHNVVGVMPLQEVNHAQNGMGVGEDGDPMYTILAGQKHGVAVFDAVQITSAENRATVDPEAPAPTMSRTSRMSAVSVALRGREGGGTAELGGDAANALRASQGGGDKEHVLTATSVATAKVRRLTPRECERLQGFPDDYTLIDHPGSRLTEAELLELQAYLNTPTVAQDQARADGAHIIEPLTLDQVRVYAADGPRYEAVGNSMAVYVMRWIGRRIAAVDNLEVL